MMGEGIRVAFIKTAMEYEDHRPVTGGHVSKGFHSCATECGARAPIEEPWFGSMWAMGARTIGLLFLIFPALSVAGEIDLSGSVNIVGNGSELPTIKRLARAFEKKNPGTVVTIQWEPTLDIVRAVKSGEADIAVSGQGNADLTAVPIAWEGIAVIVNAANPIEELTREHLAAIFSEKVKRWVEVEGERTGITASIRSENRKGWLGLGAGEIGTEIQVIDRPRSLAIRQRFEEFLGAAGTIPKTVQMIQSDQKAIDRVASDPAAVTYTSLSSALDALRAAKDIRLLRIDRVEASEQTVRDGWYQLRRPVLLLIRDEPNPMVGAFAGFALSEEGQAIVDEQFVPYGADVPSSVTCHSSCQFMRAIAASAYGHERA